MPKWHNIPILLYQRTLKNERGKLIMEQVYVEIFEDSIIVYCNDDSEYVLESLALIPHELVYEYYDLLGVRVEKLYVFNALFSLSRRRDILLV